MTYKSLSESAAEVLRASMATAGKEPLAMTPIGADLGGATPTEFPTDIGGASSAAVEASPKPGLEGAPAEPIKKVGEKPEVVEDEEEMVEDDLDEQVTKVLRQASKAMSEAATKTEQNQDELVRLAKESLYKGAYMQNNFKEEVEQIDEDKNALTADHKKAITAHMVKRYGGSKEDVSFRYDPVTRTHSVEHESNETGMGYSHMINFKGRTATVEKHPYMTSDYYSEEVEQIDEGKYEDSRKHWETHVAPVWEKHGLSPKFANAVNAHVEKYGDSQVWNYHGSAGGGGPHWFDSEKGEVKPLRKKTGYEIAESWEISDEEVEQIDKQINNSGGLPVMEQDNINALVEQLEGLSEEELEQYLATLSEEQIEQLASLVEEVEQVDEASAAGDKKFGSVKSKNLSKPTVGDVDPDYDGGGAAAESVEVDGEIIDEEKVEEAAVGAMNRKAAMKNMVAKYKGTMKEDVDALFNGESLSEDFRVKATLIFESAVQSRVEKIVEQVLVENEEVLSAAYDEIKDELTEQVDEYLNYVVEQWMEQNQVAVETGLRSELAEDFISGLRNLFQEHYIEIPEEKLDVAEELANQLTQVGEYVAAQDQAIEELSEQLNAVKKEKSISRICEGLTSVQAEKMKSLAESVEFTTDGDFDNKLAVIRENYFPSKTNVKSEVKEIQKNMITEEPEVEQAHGIMAHYVKAITKTAPKA